MPPALAFITGEFTRTMDERFRLSIPNEFCDVLSPDSGDCMLTKERVGCLGLWNADVWREKLNTDVNLVKSKIQAGKFNDNELSHVQMLARLLSTRDRHVNLAGRGRLLIPEGFREFLGVEAGGEVMIVGAGVSIEIWNPPAWIKYVEGRMPKFRKLLEHLSG